MEVGTISTGPDVQIQVSSETLTKDQAALLRVLQALNSTDISDSALILNAAGAFCDLKGGFELKEGY